MLIESYIEKFAQHMPVFLVIQSRLSALFASLYFMRRDVLPARIVVGITVLLSFYIMALGGGENLVPGDGISLIPTLVTQLFLGFLTGITINFFVEIFLGFGQVISMQAGLGMAQMYIPKLGTITSLTQFFIIAAGAIFFQLNGHLLAIKFVINSFTAGPAVVEHLGAQTLKEIIDFSGIMFSGALMLSLSVVIAVLLSNLTIGIMSKFAPQINIFSVGINISLIICFFALYISFDLIIENGNVLLNDILTFVKRVL